MTQVVSSMPWCAAALLLSEIGFGGGLVLCFLYVDLEGPKNSGVEHIFC